jgi:hypothetical protein
MEYSRRKLIYSSDKLVALSALAKATYSNKRVEYFAGIWKDSVLGGLLWYRSGPGGKARTQGCPSWSWASQDSAVSYALTFKGENSKFPSSKIVARREGDACDSPSMEFMPLLDDESIMYSSTRVIDIYTDKSLLTRMAQSPAGLW